MVAIGRALMSRPKIMLLDEPSMGLAPILVEEIFNIVSKLNREENVALLLAEQNAAMALDFAQYAYVMENGRVVLDGDAQVIAGNEDVEVLSGSHCDRKEEAFTRQGSEVQNLSRLPENKSKAPQTTGPFFF